MVVKKISNISSILLLMLSALFFVSNTVPAEPIFKTTAEATAAANSLGFQKINETVHGQAAYKKGRQYITRDVDGHNGGAWKMATSVKKLGSKATRDGTFSADLKTRIGD